MKLDFSIDDFDDRLIDEKNQIINNINEYGYAFEPPSFSKNVIVYGLHGGAQWPGAVFDPYSQNIYLQVNQIPWILRLYLTSEETHPLDMKEAFNLYEINCSSCHKKNRSGNYETIDEKSINYVPSLIKFYDDKYKSFEFFMDKVNKKHNLEINNDDLLKIYKLMINWDKKYFPPKIIIEIFNGLNFYIQIIYQSQNHLGVK